MLPITWSKGFSCSCKDSLYIFDLDRGQEEHSENINASFDLRPAIL